MPGHQKHYSLGTTMYYNALHSKKISQSASQSEYITFLFVRYVFSRDFRIQYVFDPSSPLMNLILTNSETIDTKYRAHDKIKIHNYEKHGTTETPVLITTSGPQN